MVEVQNDPTSNASSITDKISEYRIEPIAKEVLDPGEGLATDVSPAQGNSEDVESNISQLELPTSEEKTTSQPVHTPLS